MNYLVILARRPGRCRAKARRSTPARARRGAEGHDRGADVRACRTVLVEAIANRWLVPEGDMSLRFLIAALHLGRR
ncbi:MAG: hypothetical protein J2P21_26835 [Chloracidobacterium sp.]|nr:hypothetical protein [Chloracidobacterium sp.]